MFIEILITFAPTRLTTLEVKRFPLCVWPVPRTGRRIIHEGHEGTRSRGKGHGSFYNQNLPLCPFVNFVDNSSCFVTLCDLRGLIPAFAGMTCLILSAQSVKPVVPLKTVRSPACRACGAGRGNEPYTVRTDDVTYSRRVQINRGLVLSKEGLPPVIVYYHLWFGSLGSFISLRKPHHGHDVGSFLSLRFPLRAGRKGVNDRVCAQTHLGTQHPKGAGSRYIKQYRDVFHCQTSIIFG